MNPPPGAAERRVDRPPRPALARFAIRAAWAVVLLGTLATVIWAGDSVTWEGERTIYTVDCAEGAWEGTRCTGRLVAGPAYRFRASRVRQEVIYWVVGATERSGHHIDCDVKNRGNWSCNAAVGEKPTITYEMANDRATHGPAGLTIPFHATSKWKWWLLKGGVRLFSSATY